MIGPLFVKVIDAPAVVGGKALALVDDDDALVGQQISCTVHSETGSLATVTVEMRIDGEQISFDEKNKEW